MEIVRQLTAMIMPGACLLCDAAHDGAGLCAACLAELPVTGNRCYSCGAAVEQGPVCGRCRAHPPAFDHLLSAFDYAYPVDQLIHTFKYRRRLAICRALAPALCRRVREETGALPGLLLPVPLHRRRLWQRGYNQARIIARALGRELGIPVARGLAQRQRSTKEQARLRAGARQRNLRGAFTLTGAPGSSHIAIVDDVMTSGATVGELARTLRKNGVERIDVWVLARTQSEG